MRGRSHRLVGTVLTLLCAAGGSVVVDTLTAPAASAWSHTITVNQRRAATTLDQLVPEVERTCETSEKVTVQVETVRGEFQSTFDCESIRGSGPSGIKDQLARVAARQNGAATKADRVISLSQKLTPDVTFPDRDQLVWGIASSNGGTCRRAERPAEIRELMASAAQAIGETPEHWTLVEASWLAALCPHRLPALYRNVAMVGHADAAATAKRLVQQATQD
jgi:hypothetical protein